MVYLQNAEVKPQNEMESGANVTNVLAFTQNNIHLSSNFKPHTCVAEYGACLVVNMEFQIQKLNAVDKYR